MYTVLQHSAGCSGACQCVCDPVQLPVQHAGMDLLGSLATQTPTWGPCPTAPTSQAPFPP